MFRHDAMRTGYYGNAANPLDVYIGSMDNYLYLLNGDDGTMIDRFQSSGPIHGSPTIGDIDGDGKLNIIFQSWGQWSGYTIYDRLWNIEEVVVNQPPIISNLKQFKSDGTISIPEGDTTTESTVIFKANLDDPDDDQVKLQVELRQMNEPFTGVDDGGILTSDFVNSGNEVAVTRSELINGQYHWRVRAVDDKGNTSEWQEFGQAGNVDFEVKLVPLYTQIRSPYPSDDETKVWAAKQYGNGGVGGFAQYVFTLDKSDNYTLIINGEDDYAADGTRATLEVRLATYSQLLIKNPLIVKTISWPSGDNNYKNLYLNLGNLKSGSYVLRLTSVADYFDPKNPDKDAKDLNVYLDWLEIRGTKKSEIHIEAEDSEIRPNRLVGGKIETLLGRTIVKIDGYSCGRTIADCGCAMVSSVMILRYYDEDGILQGQDINPENFNEWLKANNGYSQAGGIYWSKVVEYSNNEVKFVYVSNVKDDFGILNTYLNKANPPIIREPGHFLVVDNNLANFSYNVKDPWWYNTKKLDEKATDVTKKIKDYNNHFYGMRVFRESNRKAVASLSIYVGSPVELLITDPLGRKLGKDPINNIEYNEIPDAFYLNETIDNQKEPGLLLSEKKAIYINNPLDGKYNLKVIGTDLGIYSLNILSYDNQGSSTLKFFNVKTQPNLINEYNLNIDPQQSKNTIIQPIDITPPEARIYFEPDTKTLKIEGIDDFTSNPTTAILKEKKKLIYQIQDEAENTTKLIFSKLKRHGKEIKAELKSLQYNDQPVIELPKTELKYEWSVDKKTNQIKELEQRIKVKGQFDIRTKYNHKKDQTKIKIKETKKKEIEYHLPRLVIIKLTTKSGILDFEF